MAERVLWSIEELVDNYKNPDLPGDVVWKVSDAGQRWPLFHPSEADPDGGYRTHPYSVEFFLDAEPERSCVLRIRYLVIAPRLAHLEIRVNGTPGYAYLRPSPSRSGEIRLLSGLHTAIYSEGTAEVIVPGSLLRRGRNRIVLIARDGGETIRVENIEAIRRLDRMANGAGLLYQHVALSQLEEEPDAGVAKLELKPSVVYRRREDGTLAERCHAYLELARPAGPTPLTLTLRGGGKTERVELGFPAAAFGHLHTTFDLFDGQGEVSYAASGEGFEQTGGLVRRRKWNVYLAPHAHTDIGYTHRQWEVAERHSCNIDVALEILDREGALAESRDLPSFAYHLDCSWALEAYLATRGERKRRRVIEHARAGRFGLPAAYVDLLTQYAALEDLIRNGEFTETLLRPEKLRADFSTVVDVASLSGSLPAVLEGSGVRYLVHANNQDRGPFRLYGGLHRVSPFYWEGVSGGRVLVWLSKMYCELRKVCGSPPVPSAAERGLELWLDEYEGYAPDAVLLYGQEADNTDLDPQPADFVRRWNREYAYPRLIPCDVSAFFEYVESRYGDRLATFRGDGGAYWEDGVGSTIVPSMRARHAQATLPAAERLEALSVLHGEDRAFPGRDFDDAWRELLLFDEHTWGAFLSCQEPDSPLQRDQWAVKEHMARSAELWADRLLHGAATRHSLNWSNTGREVVVYNPHSWTVSDAVTVEISSGEGVFDAESGEEVSARRINATGSQATVELWVEELEGLSYRRLALKEVRSESRAAVPKAGGSGCRKTVVLENDHYRVEVDTDRGCVASWTDKALGRELVDVRDGWGFGQLLYARGGEGTRLLSNRTDLPEGDPEVLGDFEPVGRRLERFGCGTSLKVEGRVPCGELAVEWTLRDRAKRLDVNYVYRKDERLSKEAVYVAFPLALPKAKVFSDSQLGWVNWDEDQLPGGCKEWLPLQTGVLASGAKADVFIASPDIPLFCLGDVVRGRWPKEMDLSTGRVFSYVLNNYWHTNYKASQGGEISFGYRLTSGAEIAKERAFRSGWTARRPPYAQRMSLQDFRRPRPPYDRRDGGTLARVRPEEVVLSTIKQARWGKGYVVRLQEISGKDRVASVSFPGRRITGACEMDLLERELKSLEPEPDGTLRARVPAWGLVTVRIEAEGDVVRWSD